jgi:predicted GNAT superfamily acetyltransferase
MSRVVLRILETPEEMSLVEELQRQIWPGNETDVVPGHLLLTAAHNGGLVVGAFETGETGEADEEADLEWGTIPPGAPMVGFVFSFPGLYETPDGPRPKHCSHMLGVQPQHRNLGTGFKLKRAQWQMVRHQGLDRITWTYDPLFSRNAYLNIARLGAVCNTYLREAYGVMRDGLNQGLPSDRFQVDWWIRSQRVNQRLSKRMRRSLDLAHFLAAGTTILNPSHIGEDGLPRPPAAFQLGEIENVNAVQEVQPLLLVEIPADFLALKTASPALALEWRLHTRSLFEALFERGYLATDFVHLPGTHARSFYVLSYGEAKV